MSHPFSDHSLPKDSPTPPDTAPSETTPFVIEHRRQDETPGGYFRPDAQVILTKTLRTGGLWHALAPDELKTLLLLLTFVTANGHCRPTLPQLADAMQVSEPKARTRLERLTGFRWQGQPLIRCISAPKALDAFAPEPIVVQPRDALPVTPVAAPLHTYTSGLSPAATREAVIAHSRARYTRPRAEVEAQIARDNGWEERGLGAPARLCAEGEGADPVVTAAREEVFSRLLRVSVPEEDARTLLRQHPLHEVVRQLDWLPFRHAKSPARLLVAAIEGDYEAPPAVRLQQAMAEMTSPGDEAASPSGDVELRGVDPEPEESPLFPASEPPQIGAAESPESAPEAGQPVSGEPLGTSPEEGSAAVLYHP